MGVEGCGLREDLGGPGLRGLRQPLNAAPWEPPQHFVVPHTNALHRCSGDAAVLRAPAASMPPMLLLFSHINKNTELYQGNPTATGR